MGTTFAKCPYCSAAVVRADGEVLSRYVVPRRLDDVAARRALDRWMVGNEPSRWLAGGAKLEAPELVWLPVWYARTNTSGHVASHEHRADEDALPEVKQRLVPPSGMRRLDGKQEGDDALPEPDIPWKDFEEAELGAKTIVERALVHVPYYRFVYRYRGRRYSAAVDAATGEVRPGRYPKRPTTPFVLLTLATMLTFAIADLWYGGALYWDAQRPHLFPLIYPLAWIACAVVARILTAVF